MNNFRPEDDAVILECAEKARQAGDPVVRGLEIAAQKLNRTCKSVVLRYYKLLSQKTSKEPIAKNKNMSSGETFSEKEDAVILECVAEARKTGASLTEGLKAAAQKLSRSYDSVKSRHFRLRKKDSHYNEKIHREPESKGELRFIKPSIREELAEMIRKGEIPPADKEKLARVAQKTGEHYHTVLSTFGALVACGALAPQSVEKACDWNCPWHKAATLCRFHEKGMTLKQISAWAGMSESDVENYIKIYKDVLLALSGQKEDKVAYLKEQLAQKDTEIATLNAEIAKNKEVLRQYIYLIGVIADELGVTEKPDRYIKPVFANTLIKKLGDIYRENAAVRKINKHLLNKIAAPRSSKVAGA